MSTGYRGRIAPSPTGYLHLGHARTFWIAQQRARNAGGALVLRNEDIDVQRCKPEFVEAMIEDLRWFGFDWQEGPDCGGWAEPYVQSQRRNIYLEALNKLRAKGCLYPCYCSRQDVQRALSAPHVGDEEPLYPGTCRNENPVALRETVRPPSWRFRVPDGKTISFIDGHFGAQSFIAGKDFGDFVVSRHDEITSYQLAVVADDSHMKITEVVRGADLLLSTARQLLLYRALELQEPLFFHCSLLTDKAGVRLAKRHDSLSLRSLRARGDSPQSLREGWDL